MATATSATPYIRWFHEAEATDLAQVGGKGANLGRLAGAGFPVPPGFCVTAAAYRQFVHGGGLHERILGRLAEVRDAAAIEVVSKSVRQEIRAQPIPDDIVAAIRTAYGQLGDAAAPVAIRSSATAEDLPQASFAGQQDTYLNVRGADAVMEHVRRCWASLWTARAVAYRLEQGFAHGDILLATVVQAMIESEVSGVMFTVNPVSGRRGETVINASYGLGEAIVSGLVTPDTYVVYPQSRLIRQREVGRKEVEIVYAADGSVDERPITGGRATQPSLTDAQVLALAELGQRVEDHYGGPQDIEWALRQGAFYLLQSRPITTLGDTPAFDPADHWTRAMFVEILPDAPSPQFCSVLEPLFTNMLDFTFRNLGQEPPADIPASAVFYHQPYLNLRYIRAALAGLSESSRERLAGRIANPFAEHAEHAEHAGGRPSLADLRLAWHMLRTVDNLPRRLQPVIARYYEELRHHAARDTAAMSDDELALAARQLALEILPPLVAYDFLLIAALSFAQQLIDVALARAELPDPDRVRGQLMSGVTGNLTMQTNNALWQLAQVARRLPGVVEAVTDGPDEALLERVRAAPDGPAFNAALDDFLAEYGHREIRMDIAYPTWIEDPVPVLRFVRAYLTAEGAPDPAEQERTLADQRRRAAAAVNAGLGRSIAGRIVFRRLFSWALDRAAALGRERDTMHFHWTASFPVLRRQLREIGQRLTAAGHLDDTADVYCLALDDLVDAVARPRPLQALAARRRRAWQRDQTRLWPTEIRHGEEVYEAAPGGRLAVGRQALRGIAGSPGVASGPVCIVRGPEDFGKLRRGDVLVAPLTNPVWTPLFALAGAVVTDSGGILSHGAIVAREYGLPAVMGASGATRALRDGQRVTVDGVRGTVVIEVE